MQRNAPWAASYGEHAQMVMYVKETYMTVSQQGDAGDIMYTRKCESRAPEGKFVMVHIQAGQQPQYLCMQFLKRSATIVQIKASALSTNQSLELCEDRRMDPDHWPIVHMSQSPDLNIPCPLQGGYNLRLFHPNNSRLCADSSLLTRLESDCEQGEGIVLDFRQEECIPAMLPRQVRQQVFCIAHWTQGAHSFIVLQHASVHQQTWCLRLTGTLSHPRHAHLILDLVCDPADPITQTTNFYRLQLTRRVYASTCEDDMDSQVCRQVKHLCKTPFRRHCARTCGACGKERGGDCAFEEAFRGPWVDSTRRRPADRRVSVGAYSMHVQSLGSYDCLRLQGHKKHKDKRVLVRIDENGCYPRYACAEMKKVSSSVMRFRLGDRLQWPLPQTRGHKDHVCAKENFRSRDALQSQFRVQRAPRLLVKASGINRVSCDLPRPLHHGIAFREEGQSCGGCLMYQPLVSRDRFVIRPHNCSLTRHGAQRAPSPPHHVTRVEYSCVATLTLQNRLHAVITTADTYNMLGKHLAWVFTPDGHILVLKAGDLLHIRSQDLMNVQLVEARFIHTPTERETTHPRHCRALPSTTTTHPLLLLPPPPSSSPTLHPNHASHNATRSPFPNSRAGGVSYREWEGAGSSSARRPEGESASEGKGKRERGLESRAGRTVGMGVGGVFLSVVLVVTGLFCLGGECFATLFSVWAYKVVVVTARYGRVVVTAPYGHKVVMVTARYGHKVVVVSARYGHKVVVVTDRYGRTWLSW
ncbi:hypothetical protein ACOMHN_064277 [Nucella lapillus]